MRDTIVDEVRKVRDELARQFNYDLDAMCADLQRKQQLSGAKVVSFPKRPVQAQAADPRAAAAIATAPQEFASQQ
jgi:hypothetical protein